VLFRSYDWPGNVRELENVIERASIIRENKRIGLHDLPTFISAEDGGQLTASHLNVGGLVTLDDLEKAHILAVLETTGGARKQTSEILGINASTLYRKLKKYGLQGMHDGDEPRSEEDVVPGEALLEAVESVIRESTDTSEVHEPTFDPVGQS